MLTTWVRTLYSIALDSRNFKQKSPGFQENAWPYIGEYNSYFLNSPISQYPYFRFWSQILQNIRSFPLSRNKQGAKKINKLETV